MLRTINSLNQAQQVQRSKWFVLRSTFLQHGDQESSTGKNPDSSSESKHHETLRYLSNQKSNELLTGNFLMDLRVLGNLNSNLRGRQSLRSRRSSFGYFCILFGFSKFRNVSESSGIRIIFIYTAYEVDILASESYSIQMAENWTFLLTFLGIFPENLEVAQVDLNRSRIDSISF